MIYNIELPDGSLLILSPFNQTYITLRYQRWFEDAEVTRYNSHGVFPHSKKGTEQFLTDIEAEKILVWAITLLPNTHKKGIHIGNISLQSINWINRSAEFAILIGEKEYWGKGIGKITCDVVLRHAFDHLNMNRVWTGTAQTNTAMKIICNKLKMNYEGAFQKGVFLNGRYEDVCVFAMSKGFYDSHVKEGTKI